MNTSIEDLSEEELQSFVDGGVVFVGEMDEYIEGVHEEAIGLASILLTNGCDDVPWEFTIWSGGARGGGGVQGCGRLHWLEE